ncbi:MAG: putative selenate ABC transporter substrate-binding protein [Actinomycetota bacterium]
MLMILAASSCAGEIPEPAPSAPPSPAKDELTISAIPDQDPQKLQRLYSGLATYLSQQLGTKVKYVPVTDYAASVSLFRIGDLDMVWFGGLTGAQARAQTPGARAILQRDIDEAFHSVFIANVDSGLKPFRSVQGLSALKGRRFTFGSESSTSGRLMPQYFLDQAGVGPDAFAGPPGYSGSHDKTAELVQSGAYEAGALNEQVFNARTAAGQVDPNKVVALFTTPPYHDYHWVVRPDLEKNFGPRFTTRIAKAFKQLDPAIPEQKGILELFGAGKFIDTSNSNYEQIEAIARKLDLIK